MHETAAEQKESRSPEAPADIVILFILMSMVYPWNTVHKRSVTVYADRIVFGSGYERTSSYSGTTVLGIWSFNLQNPGGDGWSEDAGMCVPYKIYGFM